MIAPKLGTGKNIIHQGFFTEIEVLTFININHETFPGVDILLNHTASMGHLKQNEKEYK